MLLEWGLRRAVRLWPEKVAFIQREADGETRLTYARFAERVDRLANALRDAGLPRGGRVAILMTNSHRFSELYYAVNLAAGALGPLAEPRGLHKPELLALLTVPVVLVVWFMVRRIRARIAGRDGHS